MSRKKSVQNIPSSVTIKCPHCSKNFRIAVETDKNIYFLDCKYCKQKIETPKMRCCIVCSFSKKKCPTSLIEQAKMKGLDIKIK